jgi:hypothetical protein
MRKKTHPIEKEINNIRLEIYEETKHMTPEELHEYYSIPAHEAAKKYGFRIIESANDV